MVEGSLALAVVELIAHAEAPFAYVDYEVGALGDLALILAAVHLIAHDAAQGKLQAVQGKDGGKLELRVRMNHVVIYHTLHGAAAGIVVEHAFPAKGQPGRYPTGTGAEDIEFFPAVGGELSAPVKTYLILGAFFLPAQVETVQMGIVVG